MTGTSKPRRIPIHLDMRERGSKKIVTPEEGSLRATSVDKYGQIIARASRCLRLLLEQRYDELVLVHEGLMIHGRDLCDAIMQLQRDEIARHRDALPAPEEPAAADMP